VDAVTGRTAPLKSGRAPSSRPKSTVPGKRTMSPEGRELRLLKGLAGPKGRKPNILMNAVRLGPKFEVTVH
jgi:hypothetical protein